MIQYEVAISPFFESNKKYCENIANKLKELNTNFIGFCNSYGYEIESTIQRNNLTYHLKFHKHQSTQNGVIIPKDAIDYAGVEITITGLDKKYNITVGKSSLARLLMAKQLKDKIPSPYFIKLNKAQDNSFLGGLIKYIITNHISYLKLNNGKLVYKIHKETTEPLSLIEDFDDLVKHWN